jgi:hypothetical protein
LRRCLSLAQQHGGLWQAIEVVSWSWPWRATDAARRGTGFQIDGIPPEFRRVGDLVSGPDASCACVQVRLSVLGKKLEQRQLVDTGGLFSR